jgi:multidrug resistance efflux pump
MNMENGNHTAEAALPWNEVSMNDTQTELPVIEDATLVETRRRMAPASVAPPKAESPAPSFAPKAGPRFSFWRLFRRTAALVMAAAAFWWLAVPFFFPVTSQAVVNARMVQVRTPIDGEAAGILHEIGDVVELGDPLLRVVSRQADTSHMGELVTRRAALISEHERLSSELAEATRARAECLANTKRFYQELVNSLKASLLEANARIQTAKVQREAAHVRTTRAEHLVSLQMGADNELDTAREGEAVAVKRIEEGEASRSKLEQELRAAEKGFLFQREAPYFEQHANELASKIPQYEGQMKEVNEKLAAAEKELQEEEHRVARLSEAAVTAPVAGAVWKRDVELGQVVKQHENLLEIADPETIFVEALLHQSHLNALMPGNRAVVKLTDGRVLNGRVRAVRTLGGADTESSFAVNLPCRDVKQVRVLIDFDPALRDASLIGRHARVMIVDEQPGAFQQAMMWIFGRLGA